MTTASSLSADEQARIRAALRAAFPGDPGIDVDIEKVLTKGDVRRVPVVPSVYPEKKWAFLSGLAGVEISLRDGGLKVSLDPVYQQQMLVVATVLDRQIAYITVEGAEIPELARLLDLDESTLEPQRLDGYAYDNAADLAQVIAEAQAEHADADFSRVPTRQTALSGV